MTHFLPDGEAIRVTINQAGWPVSIVWHGQRHPIDTILDHWRVDTRWWRDHIWRDYFRLCTLDNFLLIVFHDLIGGDWYVQRIYD